MNRTYWSDPHPRPAPAWVPALILGWAAAAGYAIARIVMHFATKGTP